MKTYFIIMTLFCLFPGISFSSSPLNSQLMPLKLPPCQCIGGQQMANCQEPDDSDCTVNDGSGEGSSCLCKKGRCCDQFNVCQDINPKDKKQSCCPLNQEC